LFTILKIANLLTELVARLAIWNLRRLSYESKILFRAVVDFPKRLKPKESTYILVRLSAKPQGFFLLNAHIVLHSKTLYPSSCRKLCDLSQRYVVPTSFRKLIDSTCPRHYHCNNVALSIVQTCNK